MLISIIISNRLKPILARVISIKKIGFVKNRHIFEAVGISQEILHIIKINKLEVMVLKLDLIKSFDKVIWTFLHFILLQVGMLVYTVNWIMGCVSYVNLFVLVNGYPSGFLNASRGLRQGCPLLPLLFLLVIEGFCNQIREAKRYNKIHGIQLSPTLVITHLLFMDDVVLFGNKTLVEWKAYKNELDLFSSTSGMSISLENPLFSTMTY